MLLSTRFAFTVLATLGLMLAPPLVPTASAGCGCDHPPPAFAPVMPPFGSPGTEVTLNADGFVFEVDSPYMVDFGGVMTMVMAQDPDELHVVVPQGAIPGPIDIAVQGMMLYHEFGEEQFTAMPPALPMPAGDGIYALLGYPAAITSDGTLLLPFDVTNIVEGVQFAFVLGNISLTFREDDVLFWNSDAVDLTLFTLDVEDPTERQWGSYYGWSVNEDGGLTGDVYNEQIMDSMNFGLFSDLLTYWRHEFVTYRDAHLPGATHEVGPNGYHTQLGTLHIDHNRLVLALTGKIRDMSDPLDPERMEPLSPGIQLVDLFVGLKETNHPIEPGEIEDLIEDAVKVGAVSMYQAPADPYGTNSPPNSSGPGGLTAEEEATMDAYAEALQNSTP